MPDSPTVTDRDTNQEPLNSPGHEQRRHPDERGVPGPDRRRGDRRHQPGHGGTDNPSGIHDPLPPDVPVQEPPIPGSTIDRTDGGIIEM